MEERARPRAEHGANSAPEPSGVIRPPEGAPGPSAPAPFLERRATADARRLRPPSPRVALLLFAAIVAAFLLYLGREALSPFVVGLLIVYLLDPPVERLARIGLPRWIAILSVYIATVFIVIEALSLTITPLIEQVNSFIEDLPVLAKSLDEQLRRLSEIYRGLNLSPDARRAIDQALMDLSERAASFDPGVLVPVFSSVAGLVASIFGYLIIPVWVFYLLKDRPTLTRAFDRSLPAEWRADTWEVIHIVERVFSQWVRAQVLLGVTVFIATYVGLLALGNLVDPVFGRFALLLAIIAGLFELLPVIGPILSAIPALLLAATVSFEAVGAALLLYFVVQQLENNLLVPKIQGDAVELHPSGVMFALVVGGAIAGLLGAILALPITAAARNVFRYLFGRLSLGPQMMPALATAGEAAEARAPAAAGVPAAAGAPALGTEPEPAAESAPSDSPPVDRTETDRTGGPVSPKPSDSGPGAAPRTSGSRSARQGGIDG
jgi:predicted PurR-regulated permease PerM